MEMHSETPRIEISGKAFEIRQSDGEIYHSGREVLAKCLKLDVSNPDAVLKVLKEICGVIDDALGAGAMKQIVGDAPVSLPLALKVLNAIVQTCGDRYAEYIRREYLGGKRHEKLRPVKP